MTNSEKFIKDIADGNTFKGDFITLGAAMLDGETKTNSFVNVPLKTMNRHGLIAGATGTGKTKTLQVLAENLSEKGVPVLLMDIQLVPITCNIYISVIYIRIFIWGKYGAALKHAL